MEITDESMEEFNFSDKGTLKQQRNVTFFFRNGQIFFIGLFLYSDWLLSCQPARAWWLLKEQETVPFQVWEIVGGSPAHSPTPPPPPPHPSDSLAQAGHAKLPSSPWFNHVELCDQKLKEEKMGEAPWIDNSPLTTAALGWHISANFTENWKSI